jgi:hypothetical protein
MSDIYISMSHQIISTYAQRYGQTIERLCANRHTTCAAFKPADMHHTQTSEVGQLSLAQASPSAQSAQTGGKGE